MEEPRPEAQVFAADRRADLERVVADHVAVLLSVYGQLEEVEVDLTDCPDIEDLITYTFLDLEGIVLQDGSELVITQFPIKAKAWDPTPGVYAIEHVDEDDMHIQSITVHDSSHDAKPPIYYHNRQPLDLDVLQELYEILGILLKDHMQGSDYNDPPHDPRSFPMPIIDLAFESIIAQLGPDHPTFEADE